MSEKWNTVKPARCANWLVLPTVYSDALSYGEQLDKFCFQLNQLIENNNIMPDFIAEMIKEYINSGAIGEVVRDILGDYILNVKYPPEGITPAVGDGSADDTAAIQGCIDYAAENGGVVYFPYGSYLTQPLTMKDGVSLFGFDRYSTKIVLKGGATKPLIGGTVVDLSIANLTLDGNSGIQVNDVNVVTITGTNVLFTNLIIKDGYTLVNYVGTGGHFQISDVVFGNAVEKCLVTAGNTDIQCENVVFNQLSAVGGISVMDIGTDGGFFNVKSVATCNKCIVVGGNNNKISAIVENASIPVVDNGSNNNIEIFGISNQEFYSDSKTVLTTDSTEVVTGTKIVEIGGDSAIAIRGKNNEHNLANKSVQIDGNSTTIIKGAHTEQNFSSKNVEISRKYVENSGEKTENISGDYLENVVGTKEIKSNQLFVNTKEPLKYGEVVDKKVKFVDKNGNAYYLLTDETKFEGDTLYNDFYVDDIVKHSPDYFNDNDTLKDYTSDQFYSLYDGIPNSDLVKTRIGVDNEGSVIYAYKHMANNKRGLNIASAIAGRLNAKAALFVSGQHGLEKQAIITLYRWFYDEFQKEFSYILENYDIMVVPCASPHNIDTNQYNNSNGVNPNRNFPIGFKPSATSGQEALDQKQTKALYDYTLEAINTYGLSLLVFNCHNSYYFEHFVDGDSSVLWYNISGTAVDNKFNNNLLKATSKIKKDILSVYPELDGKNFNRFFGTLEDGTYGGFVSGSGCRFVLAESPIRWTEAGNWYDQKTGYINYLILYNTFKACLSDEFYAPYKVNFNRLSQIGCSNKNTLAEVCDKLPPTCSLSVLLSGSSGSTLSNDLPSRNIFTGLLKITKEDEVNKCVITFNVADGARNSVEWGASYSKNYGLSNWTPHFAELTNVNFDAKNLTWDNLVNRIGNSAVLRVVSGYSLYSILPVQSSGMLFVYSPLLNSDFVEHTKICFFVSDNGGFYMNNNNTPNSSNWITIKEPA